jgi:hypothetical protein
VKAWDERGWVQALPDPDEPFVHVYAEGGTDELSEELADEVAAWVSAIRGGRRASGANCGASLKAEVDPLARRLLQSVVRLQER